MLGDFIVAENIYIACGYTDMIKSIDGLAAVVRQQFGLDPFSKSLLFWERDGFVLRKHFVIKRLCFKKK